jgi:hypothetical protein
VLAVLGWELWRRHKAKHPHLQQPPSE